MFSLLGRVSASIIFKPAASPPPRLVIEDPYLLEEGDAHWFKGDVHLASTWSLGRDLPRTLAEYYRSHGYQFMGITDSNTYTWTEAYQNRALTGIPMIKASYPFGDLLALDMDHWLNAANLQEAVDWIVQDGGMPIIASPYWHEKPQVPVTAGTLRHLFGIEIYNARVAALARDEADATPLWDDLLTRGQHVYGFAGDDVRSLQGIGSPATQGRAWIEVLAADTRRESLLSSLRRGAFFASTGSRFVSLQLDGHTLVVQAENAEHLRFIGKGGTVLQTVDGARGSYTINGGEGYVRAEVLGPNGARAWGQPYFLSWRP